MMRDKVCVMKLNWNSKLSKCVSAKLDALLSQQIGSASERVVARNAHALPVYFDFSGALGFTAQGLVVHYDLESEQTTRIADDRWLIIAAVSAAEKFPELQGILPDKPPTATTCPFCSGTGRQLQVNAFCGNCSGLGWVG
jgi:hypothetical protein